MNSDISRAINLLRVISIWLVLVLHAHTNIAFPGEIFSLISDIVSRGLGALGVPIFLAISGYLAGFKSVNRSGGNYWWPWWLRIKGLLSSYFFWNTLVALLTLIAIALKLSLGSFLSTKLSGGLLSVYGVGEEFPIAYQFWFIRELILLSTLFFLIECFALNSGLRTFFFFVVFVLVSLMLSTRWQTAAVAYSFGYFFGRQDLVLKAMSARIRHVAWLSIFTVAAFSFLLMAVWLRDWGGVEHIFFMLFGSLSLILGVLVVVSRGYRCDLLERMAPATFFIFAAHEPLLAFLRSIFVVRLGPYFAYGCSPVLVFMFLILVFRFTPEALRLRLWFMFTGMSPKPERIHI